MRPATEAPPEGLTEVHIIGTKYVDYFTDGTNTYTVPGDPQIHVHIAEKDAPIPTRPGLTWLRTIGGYLYDTASGDLEVGQYAVQPDGSYIQNGRPFVSSTSTPPSSMTETLTTVSATDSSASTSESVQSDSAEASTTQARRANRGSRFSAKLRLSRKCRPAPIIRANMESDRVIHVGRIDFRNDNRVFGIKHEDRFSHLYIIGKTGTGKSTLIETMALQDLECGNGFALIDPHGDLVARIAARIPASQRDRVVHLNTTDPVCVKTHTSAKCRKHNSPARPDR